MKLKLILKILFSLMIIFMVSFVAIREFNTILMYKIFFIIFFSITFVIAVFDEELKKVKLL